MKKESNPSIPPVPKKGDFQIPPQELREVILETPVEPGKVREIDKGTFHTGLYQKPDFERNLNIKKK